jgi:hypothetical protein
VPGWSRHPGAADQRTLAPVADGVVVGVGAICDLRPSSPEQPNASSFSVSEFVRLEDGRCVLLHEERGLTISGPVGAAALTQSVLTVVLPDDDDGARREAHPWGWLAGLAHARGLSVTADHLRLLEYEVVFSESVTRWLAEG